MTDSNPKNGNFAAGILPISFHENRILFLVGRDIRDGSFSDFGGKVERFDRGDPVATACREFYEETLGTVTGIKQIRARLNDETSIMLPGKTQNQNNYYMFITEVPYLPHLRSTFLKLTCFLRSKNVQRQLIEKTDLEYVDYENLQRVEKRGVFAKTLDSNADIMTRIGKCTSDTWRDLCKQQNAKK